MPVFENLKNFIRHGKQAYNNGENNSEEPVSNTTKASAQVVPPAPEQQQKESSRVSGESHRKDAYNDAAKKIVAEEKEQRTKLPKYQGLSEDRYKLLEKVGDGAFSVVYKAYDMKMDQQVAVKVVHKQDLSSSQNKHLGRAAQNEQNTVQRSSILKEVAIMRQLHHDNIVNLIEFSESKDYYFIVLELIPGGELFHQIVRLTYFSEDLSRHVILQVAHAIRYLHEEAGVVHRDIKPENLLFYPCTFIPSDVKTVRKGEDLESKEDEGKFTPGVGAGGIGQIKLADFGLSKIIWDSKTMTPCGTVGYTAPEIVKDERYSKSVDMWALGCVLYTVLCGFPPFYDESIEVLTEKVAKGQYTFLSPWWDEISKSAKDLVSHLLTVDPDKRYTIDEFLSHPWITQSQEPTMPAYDAPTKPSIQVSDSTSKTFVPQSSSANTTTTTTVVSDNNEFDGGILSPAAVTLKEVFDVSNAVHRMEEENSRSNRFSNNINNNNNHHNQHRNKRGGKFLDNVQEEESLDGVQKSLEQVNMNNEKKKQYDEDGNLFELHLEGATLLERRRRKLAS